MSRKFVGVKIFRSLLCISVLFCAIQLCAQQRFNYSTAEADSILHEFHEAINSYHPFAFRENGQERLDSMLLEVQAKIPSKAFEDSIHVAALIHLISEYNAIIGDGHLQLTRKRDSSYVKNKKLYDYDFYTRYVEDGRIILSDTLVLLDSTTYYPGTEVLSFQGVPTKKNYEEISSFIGLSDHNIASAKTYFPALNPGSFYQRLYGWKDSLVAELQLKSERVKITMIPGPRMAYLNRDTTLKKSPKKKEKLSRKQKKQEAFERMKSVVHLDTTSSKNVYKIVIRTFSSSAFNKVNQYSYTRKLMKRLDSLGAKGLIIDVRNNTGGSLNFVNHIYGMIADRPFVSGDIGIGYCQRARGSKLFGKIGNTIFGGVRKKNGVYYKKSMSKTNKPERGKEHFNGEVVVLVNETTFSGGTCLANYVKTYNRGKLVGQISGGSAERMYAGTLFKESIGPGNSLLINMPLWYMDMPGNNKGNVVPDVIVPRTASAVVAQKDKTLEVAIQQFTFVKESL